MGDPTQVGKIRQSKSMFRYAARRGRHVDLCRSSAMTLVEVCALRRINAIWNFVELCGCCTADA